MSVAVLIFTSSRSLSTIDEKTEIYCEYSHQRDVMRKSLADANNPAIISFAPAGKWVPPESKKVLVLVLVLNIRRLSAGALPKQCNVGRGVAGWMRDRLRRSGIIGQFRSGEPRAILAKYKNSLWMDRNDISSRYYVTIQVLLPVSIGWPA